MWSNYSVEFITQLSQLYNALRPLTEFELLFVPPNVFKGLISTVYNMLMCDKEVRGKSKLYWEIDLGISPSDSYLNKVSLCVEDVYLYCNSGKFFLRCRTSGIKDLRD